MAHERTFPFSTDANHTHYVNVTQLLGVSYTDNNDGTYRVDLIGVSGKQFNNQQDAQDEVDLWRARIEDAR